MITKLPRRSRYTAKEDNDNENNQNHQHNHITRNSCVLRTAQKKMEANAGVWSFGKSLAKWFME